MRSKSFRGMTCSIAGALEAIGDRWAFLILRDLSLGLGRFDELQRSTGIPNTTLAQRLNHLRDAGLAERVQYQDNPPRFEYRLTEKGRRAGIVILALAQWGDRFDLSGAGAPPVRFVNRENGKPIRLAVVDARSGELVSPGNVEAKAGPGADDVVRWRLSHLRKHEKGATPEPHEDSARQRAERPHRSTGPRGSAARRNFK